MPSYTIVTPAPPADVSAVRDQLALLQEELRASTSMLTEKITELETRLERTEAQTRLLSDQVNMQEKEKEKEEEVEVDLNPGRPRPRQRRKPLPLLMEATVPDPEQHFHQPTAASTKKHVYLVDGRMTTRLGQDAEKP